MAKSAGPNLARLLSQLFDDDDLRLALRAPPYHFVEWYSAIYVFGRYGYRSLLKKYSFPKHAATKGAILVQRLGKDALRFLQPRRHLEGQPPDLFVYDAGRRTGNWFVEVKASRGWVSISPALVTALHAHIEAVDLEGQVKDWTIEQRQLVFPNTQGRITHHGPFMELVWRPLLLKAKLPYRKYHSTRHTYATWLLEATKMTTANVALIGCDPTDVVRVVAHEVGVEIVQGAPHFIRMLLVDAEHDALGEAICSTQELGEMPRDGVGAGTEGDDAFKVTGLVLVVGNGAPVAVDFVLARAPAGCIPLGHDAVDAVRR